MCINCKPFLSLLLSHTSKIAIRLHQFGFEALSGNVTYVCPFVIYFISQKFSFVNNSIYYLIFTRHSNNIVKFSIQLLILQNNLIKKEMEIRPCPLFEVYLFCL